MAKKEEIKAPEVSTPEVNTPEWLEQKMAQDERGPEDLRNIHSGTG